MQNQYKMRPFNRQREEVFRKLMKKARGEGKIALDRKFYYMKQHSESFLDT